MNVLVLGGSGFVGSHVAAEFAQRGHDVRSLSRDAPRFGEIDGVEYAYGDAASPRDLDRSVAGADLVVFAITSNTPGSAQCDPELDLISNVVAGLRLLEAATRHGVAHAMLLSSAGTVYGRPRSLPIAEDHPTNPISAYGVSRLTLEKYFAAFCSQTEIPTSILRIGNAFGERQAPGSGQGASAAFLAALLEDRPIEIWGDGSIVRDYVYAGDVARACVQLADRRIGTASGEAIVVNIGSGEGTRLLDLLAICSRIVGNEPRVSWSKARIFDVPEIVLDIGRAWQVAGWRPETSLVVGLERTASFLAETRVGTRG